MLLWSYMGEGVSDVPFTFPQKFLRTLNVFLITIYPVTLVSIDDSTLLLDWIFVFGRHQEVPDGGASFKVHLYPKLAANVLDALTKSTVVGNHYVGLLLVVHTSFLCWSLVGVLFLCFLCILLRAQVGYLHFLSALFRCCSSFAAIMGWSRWFVLCVAEYQSHCIWMLV